MWVLWMERNRIIYDNSKGGGGRKSFTMGEVFGVSLLFSSVSSEYWGLTCSSLLLYWKAAIRQLGCCSFWLQLSNELHMFQDGISLYKLST